MSQASAIAHTPTRPHRTAIVTGGGSGIGRGIALALARHEVDVALVGRQVEPLTAVAAEVTALGVRGVALPADLTVAAERDGLLARVRVALGEPGMLVHAAGVLAGGALAEIDEETIARAVALNLTAPLLLTRAALPDLAAQRGAVVFVASMAALVPLPSASVYSATKAGVAALGEALRYETAPLGVRVLVAYPPGTATAMTRGMAAAAGLPGYRLADAEGVGERIVTALLAGRREWRGSGGERALAWGYRFTPTLVRALLRSQRARFQRMMTAPARTRREEDR